MNSPFRQPVFPLMLILLMTSCAPEPPVKRCMEVTASAYNSLPYQTRAGSSGKITAWGDTLRPEVASVAVSRDLIDSGLVYGTKILIEGFADTFLVNDKMNRRYRKMIDIHMNENVRKAREFGRRKVTICWEIPDSLAHER